MLFQALREFGVSSIQQAASSSNQPTETEFLGFHHHRGFQVPEAPPPSLLVPLSAPLESESVEAMEVESPSLSPRRVWLHDMILKWF